MRLSNWGVGCRILALCLCFCAGPLLADDPVFFADANLKAAVESALNVSDPTESDMLNLTQLDAYNRLITDLTGLEYATNLTKLKAFGNDITDISPLAGLTKITFLDLFWNDITDLSPVSGMTRLQYINIEGSNVSDLTPLSGMRFLIQLYADENRIEDISMLSGLVMLRELEIDGNKIQDISVLEELSTVVWLDLDGNEIRDISPIKDLRRLIRLDLRDNPLNEDACTKYLPKIIQNNPGIDVVYDACSGVNQHTLTLTSTQGGSVTAPGEGSQGPFASATRIAVEATPEAGYVFAEWTGSAVDAGKVADVYAASTEVIVDSTVTATANFAVDGPGPLSFYVVDDNAPMDPRPGDLTVSDALEDGSVQHPFDSIQEAIDLAEDGSVIQVLPGTYFENIDFLGKAIEVVGMEPNDPNTGHLPVLYGLGHDPTVRLSENASGLGPILKGMAVVGAKGTQTGAIECTGCAPTIINCLITGNYTSDATGGAVWAVDCNLMILNSTIADNTGGDQGGGIVLQNTQMLMLDSIVWGNAPQGIRAHADSLAVAQFCNLQEAGLGQGNIVADPLFAASGNWVHPDVPILILTGAHSSSVWLPGDYHLKSQQGRWDDLVPGFVQDDVTSPCIDAASDLTPIGQESAPNGDRLNQGVFGGTVFASQTHGEPLGFVIKDENLKIAIMEILGLWSEPQEQDMLSLYRLVDYFYTTYSEIRDLTGLEYAHNLQEAQLRGNLIQDVSPLANLTLLQTLNVSENQITSIAPLSGLTSLRVLDVHGNEFSDMSPVANLTRLEKLTSRDNRLSGSLSFLDELVNLTHLDLQENQITDLGAIRKLTKLRELDISDNLVYSISALSKTPDLRKVDVSRNRIADISPLTGLVNLTLVDLEYNVLTPHAYASDLQTIQDNNPGVDLRYTPSHYRASVTASDGTYGDRVHVSWTEIKNGPNFTTYYQVYRSDTATSPRVALSAWQTAREFDDTTASSGVTYYYSVRTATSDQGDNESSSFSSANAGHR